MPSVLMRVRMKFVVPLMMPMTRRMRSPARDSFKGLMMGMPPATAASKARSTPVCSASSKSSLPRVASNSLLEALVCAHRAAMKAGSDPEPAVNVKIPPWRSGHAANADE